jgi:sulfur relay (sulfurtransferase) DsrF/TusC family protein
MKTILCVVESAYRGTQEEQDDAVFWLTHAIQKAGGSMAVLLRGNAVNYLVAGQDPSGVLIGKRRMERPLYPQKDIAAMKVSGIAVFAVLEDIETRGIARRSLIGEVELVSQGDLPAIFGRYDQVWHW